MVSERSIPEPIGPDTGGTDPGPRNKELDRQNPDILTPPSTDSGTLPNLKFSFSLAHNRLQKVDGHDKLQPESYLLRRRSLALTCG